MRNTYFLIIILITFATAVFSQNSPVQTLIREGVILHDSTQYAEAIVKFEEALKIDPKSSLALYELSLTHLEMKNYDKALEYSTKVINLNDQNLLTGAYAVKSQALTESGDVDKAIQLLKEGLEKVGESHHLHFNLALDYYKINDTDNALKHVTRAIELNKGNCAAFLLSAYVWRDKGMWIRSIFSFQMFLLLEPDSRRSKNAFSEMLEAMFITEVGEEPVQRSFVQMQLDRGETKQETPPLAPNEEVDRDEIAEIVKSTVESLRNDQESIDTFETFLEVNKVLVKALDQNINDEMNEDGFWNFYYPFFHSILNSDYYETYARYISVSYYPESLEWWDENSEEAQNFINWFEKGDDGDNC